MAWDKRQAGAVISKLNCLRGGDWIVRFGKYRGKHLRDLPHAYLRWMGTNIERGDAQENIQLYREEYARKLHATE